MFNRDRFAASLMLHPLSLEDHFQSTFGKTFSAQRNNNKLCQGHWRPFTMPLTVYGVCMLVLYEAGPCSDSHHSLTVLCLSYSSSHFFALDYTLMSLQFYLSPCFIKPGPAAMPAAPNLAGDWAAIVAISKSKTRLLLEPA